MDKLHRGSRVIITILNNETYEGLITSINKESGRISLTDVTKKSSNSAIQGTRHFYKSEITDSEVLSSASGEVLSDSTGSNLVEEAAALTGEAYDAISQLQNEYRLITNTSNNFYNAIEKMNNCKMIGIWAEDVSRGRRARASILAASTGSHIFLFDLENMGDNCLDKGLRAILESHDIIKVVYDCRLLSDCLFHCHVTKLSNVFDVEAEDILVHQQIHGKVRVRTKPIQNLIREYLGIPNTIIFDEMKGKWKTRPMALENQQLLVSAVSYLLLLHDSIEQKFLQKLRAASRIYCNKVRQSESMEAESERLKVKKTLHEDLLSHVFQFVPKSK